MHGSNNCALFRRLVFCPNLWFARESKGVFSLQASGSSKHGGYGRHFVCRCVEEYIKDTKLDHVPDILCGLSVDDKIHQSYHEVVMSDSDVDKLVSPD